MIELAALAPYGDLSLFAAYGGLGLVVGFVAGLLGVGGGLIIVPVLIMLLHTHGQAVGMEPQLALGTSLATILFTSLSSVRAHHAAGLSNGLWYGASRLASCSARWRGQPWQRGCRPRC